MNRREYLSAAAIAGGVAVAGCTGDLGSRTLADPTVDRADEDETHLRFDVDGDRVGTVTVRVEKQRYGAAIPVGVYLAHPDEVRVTAVDVKLRAPPGGTGVPAEVAFVAKPWDRDIEFSTDPRDGGAVLSIPYLGPQGDSTVVLQFILWLVGDASELLVDGSFDVTETGLFGRAYTLDARTRASLPPATT